MRFKKIINSTFLKFYKVKINEIVLDHDKYLGKSENTLKIYNKPPINMILSPFDISFELIDRLLLINFEEDPLYFGIELQVIPMEDKFYPLVIMYRKDDLIDIYITNEAAIQAKKKINFNLIHNTSITHLENIDYNFDIDEMGLNAYLLLKDKFDNKVEFRIRENIPCRDLSSILAPNNAVIKNPLFLPIIYLNEFSMVIKKDTEIFIKINEDLKKPAELPVKIENQNFYLARYSLDPIICNLNTSITGNLNPILLKSEIFDSIIENLSYKILNNDGFFEIKKIIGVDGLKHSLSLEFSPAFPNLLSLKSEKKIKGRFSLTIGKKKGIFAGVYYINRIKEFITIIIYPTKGWQPFPGKLWLKMYKWVANIEILEDLQFKIHSKWIRI